MKSTLTLTTPTPETSFRLFLQSELARRCARNSQYSLRAFAVHVNVDHSTLSQWLRGRRPMTRRSIETLGETLGIPGGFWPSPPEGHNLVQLFIRVDSVPDYVGRAEKLGARTIIAPQTLPEGDVLAILLDPQGLPFGIMSSPR